MTSKCTCPLTVIQQSICSSPPSNISSQYPNSHYSPCTVFRPIPGRPSGYPNHPVPVIPRIHLAHLLPPPLGGGTPSSSAPHPTPDLLISHPNLPPSSSSPRPFRALPSFPSNPNSPAHAPAPNPSHARFRPSRFRPSPHRSVWMPENGLHQGHSPRRSRAERARGPTPGGEALVAPFRRSAVRRPFCCVVPVAEGQCVRRGRGLLRSSPSPEHGGGAGLPAA